MHKSLLALTIVLFLSLNLAPKSAFAADCTMIYGGGEIDCGKITPSPTPKNQVANKTQTKGGLTVYNSTKATKTPATGPETIGLISLIPMAAAGYWLRKK